MSERFRVMAQVSGTKAYVSTAAMPKAEAERLCALANAAERVLPMLPKLGDGSPCFEDDAVYVVVDGEVVEACIRTSGAGDWFASDMTGKDVGDTESAWPTEEAALAACEKEMP